MGMRSWKSVCVGAMTLAALSSAAAPAAAATVGLSGHASPQTFKYVGSFFTYGDCEAYGYSNYNGYNNTWFCTQSNNPDTLPWSLYHEDSV
ncbi:hypothetical protein GCM10009765_76730 [Fodinicola feengrottensis]|uniref:Secreted protein n=1 Tax=Fodinicola feengrottensis TaxID=435914 RepID=A0ABN2J2P4_9ACTN